MKDLLWHLTSAYMSCVYGWEGVRYVITKFSRMDSLPNILTRGAPLRALFARARAPLLYYTILYYTILYYTHSLTHSFNLSFIHSFIHLINQSINQSIILFSTINVKLVDEMIQSAYLCVILLVKHKKLPYYLILGEIQDSHHCWWRHRPSAAPPPIK